MVKMSDDGKIEDFFNMRLLEIERNEYNYVKNTVFYG